MRRETADAIRARRSAQHDALVAKRRRIALEEHDRIVEHGARELLARWTDVKVNRSGAFWSVGGRAPSFR